MKKIIPNTGYPLLWLLRDNGASYNKVFNNVDELVAAVPVLDNTPGISSVYFGLGSVIENRKDKVRVTENIHAFRTLWADIDVKQVEGFHHSQAEAVTAAGKFCAAIGWPMPMLVSSGTGVHAYWPLTEDISVDQWRAIAPLLLSASYHNRFMIDRAAANKATQVLRPPGSTHRKDINNPKPVRILRDAPPSDFNTLKANITSYCTTHKLDMVALKAPTQSLASLLAASGMTYSPPVMDRDVGAIVSGCAQMQMGLHGDVPEPTWRGVLSVCLALPKGRSVAHILSKNDTRYTAAATEEKMDQMLQSTGHAMPYSCAKFEQENPDGCAGCRHRGVIKFPISLGNPVVTEEVEASAPPPPPPPPPPVQVLSKLAGLSGPPSLAPPSPTTVALEVGPYKIEQSGVWMKTPADSDDPDIHICEQRVLPLSHMTRLDDDGNWERRYLVRIEFPEGASSDVVIFGKDVHNGDNMLHKMASYGVVITKQANFMRFGNFMRALTQLLQEKSATEMRQVLGWQEDGSFVAGAHTAQTDGQMVASVLASEAKTFVERNHVTTAGAHEDWRAAIDVFKGKGQEHAQLAVCASFGAPLMKFSAVTGLVLSLHGVSGAGKSAIQAAAASVWGKPAKLMLTAPGTKSGSSQLAVARHMGVGHSLPALLEEVTNLPPEEVSDLIHSIVGGAEKTRLNKKGDEYQGTNGLTWETITITSSNNSLTDMLTAAKTDSRAERMRLFEISNISLVKGASPEKVLEDTNKLKKLEVSYGTAGIHYARWLVHNRDFLEGWVEDQVAALTKRVKGEQHERFWIQGMACVLVGARIAFDAGLHSYDVDALEDYIVYQIDEQREAVVVTEVSTETLFAEMLSDLMPTTLTIANIAGVEAVDDDNFMHFPPKAGKVEVRVDLRLNTGFIASNALGNWCRVRRIDRSVVLRSAINGGYMIPRVKAQRPRLAMGVSPYGNSQVNAYAFTLSDDEVQARHAVLTTNEETAK